MKNLLLLFATCFLGSNLSAQTVFQLTTTEVSLPGIEVRHHSMLAGKTDLEGAITLTGIEVGDTVFFGNKEFKLEYIVTEPTGNQWITLEDSLINQLYGAIFQAAQFPGGPAAMNKFILDNLVYPQIAMEADLEGRCRLGIVIGQDGSITDLKVRRSVPGCPECDAEFKRIVKRMPKWIPAKIGENTITSSCEIPFNFQFPFSIQLMTPIIRGKHQSIPQFPGGEEAMFQFFKDNVTYPKIADEEYLKGRCIVDFTASASGKIKKVVVSSGVYKCPECDAEAIRLVQSMPTWTHGKAHNFSLVINFNPEKSL